MISPDHIYTLEEYWKIVDLFPDHKYEYIHGHIRMMSRGTPSHSQIGANVVYWVKDALRKNASECVTYNSDIMIQLNEGIYYHPDAAVSCDPMMGERGLYSSSNSCSGGSLAHNPTYR